MIRLLTFCNDRYTVSAANLCRSAEKHGVDQAIMQRDDLIPPLFLRLIGENIKEIDRYWFYIWKPYIIWEFMSLLPDGDTLIYCDAGTTIVSSVMPPIREMEQDIQLYHNPWKHVEWCKSDVIAGILGWGGTGYIQTDDMIHRKQSQASFMIFKVTPETRAFVKEWMLYCLMPGFCDNSQSKLPNYPTFQEHRYDQAVLTCLAIKYGYSMKEIPRIDNGNSPHKILDHHRKSNEQW